MSCWQDENYGEMGQVLWKMGGDEKPYDARAGEVREKFSFGAIPEHFRIDSVDDEAASVTQIELIVCFDEEGEWEEHEATVRLTYQGGDERPLTRGALGGRWQIVEAVSQFPIVWSGS
jgi:hypothetical protein